MLAGFAVLIVFVTAAIAGVVSAMFGGSHTANCTPTGVSPTGVSGFGPDQIANAAIIVAVGKHMTIPERGWIIALATAIQESGLRNLDHGDRDSLGLFQQRPSQGWGSAEDIMNPTYSATQFYRHLLAVPGWQQMSINDAAQAVQRSGFPHAYARHEPAAQQLLATVHGSTCAPTGTWTIPVAGQCTSGFGPRGSEFHRGQDIAAPIGTPIVAASSGTVIDSGPATGYGLWVRIRHADGVITTYGHNDHNHVHIGQTVQTGQVIAEVGNRGESTGPHLHFQIEISGQPTDPTAFYRQRSAPPLCDQRLPRK
ncbi:M23 family metallopeptidase [Saccharopolyspora sp. K220]|uniref:M23 family metallopeptidase n=1 Tax=Saccharopolyspora soli TaxID=2926618 RepID=UPI001F599A6C|nr:M23 family metallopeptidase [Saccharopolyspora soli]MCI2420061.1 M23 family metallopeptidase [Saccharopolyspora soli]